MTSHSHTKNSQCRFVSVFNPFWIENPSPLFFSQTELRLESLIGSVESIFMRDLVWEALK